MNLIEDWRIKLLAILLLVAFLTVGLAMVLDKPVDRGIMVQAAPSSGFADEHLLARLIFGEAANEPIEGQVAVAAVILNRVKDPKFPNSLAGVVYEPHAFESVSNGQIWSENPGEDHLEAAQLAINGWDPTYGCTFFWNPHKPVTPWIWSRALVRQIGNHVFAR